ncbi:MAG: signal peptidase II [Lachnospiraceae bacterium]|nr:signal peptidase II [Lachnospiraceae bacterium]
MAKKTRIIWLIADLIFIGVLFCADRITKLVAKDALMGGYVRVLIPEVLEFRYLENYGAAFGMLQNFRILFIILGIVAIAIIFFYLIRIPATKKYRLLRISLCFLSAGAAGNLYDRIVLNHVIDFIYFSNINFPVFNVADCYVTLSTAVLIILLLFVFREEDLDLKKLYGKAQVSKPQETEKVTEETDGK